MARESFTPDLRKRPQQERSRAMVERILVAGQEVLLRDGLGQFSTNRVARQAGISPGSLYQYFPDKQAILVAVVDRHAEQLSVRLTAVLADHLDKPGPELVRATLHGLLDALTENLEFVRLVGHELPRAQFGTRTAATEQRVGDLVAAYLTINRSTSRVADPSTAAWMLVRTVEHLVVQYLLEEPAIARDEFVEQLATLVLGYVEPA
jgi:AcrR family transcriptional regulator